MSNEFREPASRPTYVAHSCHRVDNFISILSPLWLSDQRWNECRMKILAALPSLASWTPEAEIV